MVRCSVLGCRSDSGRKIDGISFHSFPTDPEIQKVWIKATKKMNWVPRNCSRMCSKHFHVANIVKKGKVTILYPKAVPLGTQLPAPRVPRKIPQITPNCPQCYADLPMTTIARDARVRLVIAKVYQYLEEEYDELKCLYPDTDLFMLSEFSRRTAAATGVTEALVQEILGEEAAAQPPPAKRARTAEDGSIDDDVDDDEGNVYNNDSDEQTEEVVQVVKAPGIYINRVPMLEIKPLIGFEEETLIIKEEPLDTTESIELEIMDVSKQEPSDELHSEDINVYNTVAEDTSDEIVRMDKQKTTSEPTGHVSTTYVYNTVANVSSDEIARRYKQKTTSEPTGHISTEDPLSITEVKQEDIDIKEEGIS